MTQQAVDALRHEIDVVTAAVVGWSAEEWGLPSRATGWSNKDIICHLGAVFQQLCDPDDVPADTSLGEHSVDLAVEARRHLLPHEVVESYLRWSSEAIGQLQQMQAPALADQVVPMSILGSHPLHLLANAYAFDHHCHVRHDLGICSQEHLPPGVDPGDLTAAAVDWMMAAAPQMCPEVFACLSGPVDLRIGESTWRLSPLDDGSGRVTHVATGGRMPVETCRAPVAVVSSSAEHFVLWGTQRVAANDLGVHVIGDEQAARIVVDTLRIF